MFKIWFDSAHSSTSIRSTAVVLVLEKFFCNQDWIWHHPELVLRVVAIEDYFWLSFFDDTNKSHLLLNLPYLLTATHLRFLSRWALRLGFLVWRTPLLGRRCASQWCWFFVISKEWVIVLCDVWALESPLFKWRCQCNFKLWCEPLFLPFSCQMKPHRWKSSMPKCSCSSRRLMFNNKS